jgi:hypothetical protein
MRRRRWKQGDAMKSKGIRVGGGSRTGFRFAFGSFLAMGVLLAGCSSAASSPAGGPGGHGVEAAPAAMAAPSPASRDSAFGSLQNTADARGSTAEGGGTLPDVGGPLIVRTGELDLRVSDLDAAISAAERAVAAVGGYVAGSQRSGDGDQATASVIFRVPAARWTDALIALRAIGTKVLGEQTSSQEVTAQVVDLGARLANLRVTETALQGIMDRATKIPDVLAVQAQLTDVRGQIEELTAEQQTLQNQAALATLTVTFAPPPVVAVTAVREGWDPASEIDQATATLVGMGQGLAGAGIWLLIVGLPVVLVVGVLALIGLLVVRRVRPGASRPAALPPVAGA